MIEQHLRSFDVPPGEVFYAPFDVILGLDGVQPDLLYISSDRAHFITAKNAAGPPDWIIEILSSDRKHDLETKRSLYQRSGVIVYWVVDPTTRTIHVWDWHSGTETIIEGDAMAAVRVLPGLQVPLERVFEKPD
jgi:Uma2 family endonuclease